MVRFTTIRDSSASVNIPVAACHGFCVLNMNSSRIIPVRGVCARDRGTLQSETGASRRRARKPCTWIMFKYMAAHILLGERAAHLATKSGGSERSPAHRQEHTRATLRARAQRTAPREVKRGARDVRSPLLSGAHRKYCGVVGQLEARRSHAKCEWRRPRVIASSRAAWRAAWAAAWAAASWRRPRRRRHGGGSGRQGGLRGRCSAPCTAEAPAALPRREAGPG